MPYRRTEKVEKRLQARRAALIAAARAIAAERGLDSVQIAPVAERASTAAGTVYRYFASKQALVSALIADVTAVEIAAMRAAAAAAPGPLSALAASLSTFAARVQQQRRLVWASIGEPVDASLAPLQQGFRAALAAEIATLVRRADAGGHVSGIDPGLVGAAIVGLFVDVLLGPLAPAGRAETAATDRAAAQAATLCALRAAGVVDARARGLVVQAPWPAVE